MREADRQAENREGLSAALSRSNADPPSPGRWTKAPQRAPLESPWWGGIAWLALGLFVLAIFWNPILAAPSIVFALCNNFWDLRRKARVDWPTVADRRLLEDPDDPDVCLVRIEVFRGGESVGSDRGVVWFADGLLLYSGHRTSFAIGGQDVRPEGIAGLEESDVPLRIDRRTTTLRIVPLVVNGGGMPQDMRFLKRLYEFRRRPTSSSQPRQWPPLEPWIEPHTPLVKEAPP